MDKAEIEQQGKAESVSIEHRRAAGALEAAAKWLEKNGPYINVWSIVTNFSTDLSKWFVVIYYVEWGNRPGANSKQSS